MHEFTIFMRMNAIGTCVGYAIGNLMRDILHLCVRFRSGPYSHSFSPCSELFAAFFGVRKILIGKN